MCGGVYGVPSNGSYNRWAVGRSNSNVIIVDKNVCEGGMAFLIRCDDVWYGQGVETTCVTTLVSLSYS